MSLKSINYRRVITISFHTKRQNENSGDGKLKIFKGILSNFLAGKNGKGEQLKSF